MKFRWLKHSFIFLISILLSACLTTNLWKEDKTEIAYSPIDTDSLIALGENSKTGQLVIIGEKYWFVLTQKSSEKIRPIISAKLSAPVKTNETIKITLSNYKKNEFDAFVTLYYSPVNEAEKEKVKNIGFQCLPNYCQKIFGSIYGEIYKNNEVKLTPKEPLKQKLPIEIRAESKTRTSVVKGANVISKILQTPATLIGDVLLLPFQFLYVAEISSDK